MVYPMADAREIWNRGYFGEVNIMTQHRFQSSTVLDQQSSTVSASTYYPPSLPFIISATAAAHTWTMQIAERHKRGQSQGINRTFPLRKGIVVFVLSPSLA